MAVSDIEDKRLTGAVRRVLDEATGKLDDATLKRLGAARERALATAKAGPRAPHIRRAGWLWPLGAAISASLVAAVGAWLWFATPAANGPPMAASVDDLELLATREAPDFYADLEFYAWLASHQDAG
jgi:hypothetical protein